MKTALCLALALLAAGALAQDLPSRDVSGWADGEVERTLRQVGPESWWVRVGDTLYSPALAPPGQPVDPGVAHYAYYVGAPLPATLSERRVGGTHDFHLLHFPGGGPHEEGPAHCLSHGLGGPHPVTPGIEWKVPYKPQAGPPPTRDLSDAQVLHLLTRLDADRYLATVTTLADFGTRETGSQGNVNARDWIAGEFASLGLTVTTPEFTVFGTPTRNVVGTKTGVRYPDEYIVVGGHFDSRGTGALAPGSEDNASGTAGVLEIARALAPYATERTIHFIAFSGEEQGLYGSKDWTSDLTPAQRAKCKGALIMDMIAYTGDAEHDVVLSTTTPGLQLRGELAAAGAQFTSLSISTTTGISGSDHTPFLGRNMPAVLSIEGEYGTYPGYHNSGDVVANITKELGIAITRMNLAVAARLAVPELGSAASDAWLLAE